MNGHWNTPEGAEMAKRYFVLTRDDLVRGDVSDMELANSVFMAGRNDIDLGMWQTAAKERIRWLSAQLAAVSHKEQCDG
jgi:hypothetical protein